MAGGKVDAIQARVKAAVAKEAADYGERNKHEIKEGKDKGKIVKPEPPRLWFENKVSTLVSLGELREAFVDDLVG